FPLCPSKLSHLSIKLSHLSIMRWRHFLLQIPNHGLVALHLRTKFLNQSLQFIEIELLARNGIAQAQNGVFLEGDLGLEIDEALFSRHDYSLMKLLRVNCWFQWSC